MFEPVTITSTVVATGWLAACGVGVIPARMLQGKERQRLTASSSLILLTFRYHGRGSAKGSDLSRQKLQEPLRRLTTLQGMELWPRSRRALGESAG